jgi:predicted nucleotidyltransferase/DNA-binding HxlR family transcriptional regulator
MVTLVDVVSSRVKAAILRLLFGSRPTELHLRELVRQSGLSLGTVQQELRRLTRIGIVVARKDGNRVYYRANPGHPLHPELRSLVLKTDGLAGVLEGALEDKQVLSAFVFGSVARGEAGAESDVDLMVIGAIGLRRLTQLLSGVAEKVGREINPHILTSEEFKLRKRRGDHFLSTVLASTKLFVKGNANDLEAMVR